jgi:hypothetical protein
VAYTPVRLFGGTIPAAATTQYTSTGVKTIIKQITIVNTASAAATVRITVANHFACYDLNVAGNAVTILDLSMVMNAGETIVTQASTGTMNVQASGVTF